jgi:hypothetical protein
MADKTEEFIEQVRSKEFSRFYSSLSDDCSDAAKQAKSLMQNSMSIPDDDLKELRDELADCLKAEFAFDKAYNKIINGAVQNPIPLFNTTLTAYIQNVQALQQVVAYVDGLNDADLAGLAQAILNILNVVAVKSIGDLEKSYETLERLENKIDKTRKKLRNAKVQKFLNELISAISLAYSPEAKMLKSIKAVAALAAHFATDAALDPAGISKYGAALTVIGDILDVVPRVTKAVGEPVAMYYGWMSAIKTAESNDDSINEVIKELSDAKVDFDLAKIKFEIFARNMKSVAGELPKLNRALNASKQAAEQAKAKSKQARGNYNMIKKLIKGF